MMGRGFPIDVDALRTSWRRATPVQKAVRVGIVGGFLGGFVYLLGNSSSGVERHRLPELPPEPVERDPSAVLLPAPPKRGHR